MVTFAAPLPPPPPDALPVPGPSARADVTPRPVTPTVAERIDLAVVTHRPDTQFAPPAPVHAAGLEPGDAFELIWPTGEIDEQLLGGLLSEVLLPGEPFSETAPTVPAAPGTPGTPHDLNDPDGPDGPVAGSMTVQLRPLAVVPAAADATIAGPVSDDVVLAIRRAIAALGSERSEREPIAETPGARRGATAVVAAPPPPKAVSNVAVVASVDWRDPTPTRDMAAPPVSTAEVAPAPRLSDRSEVAAGADPSAIRSESTSTDERRSALKRLISGLRRR